MLSLDPFFRPASVAVVGASVTPGAVGSIIMRNLLANPFGGVVYPVNPKRKAVHGVLCYPSLRDLPEAVELAVIATPAATVPATIQQCVERGIKAAIVISAGFSELGAEGRKLEKQIRDIALGKMRIVGPNCLGIIHPSSGMNASFASSMPQTGRVALLSQSGAICTSILDWARERNVGFSTFVSVGTMLDVDFADLIDYFGDDPATRSIVLYMESVGDVKRFVSAARAVARSKHVIVVKAGRHEAGAKAAASHTGALAGSDAVFDAAIRRAGVLRVSTIPDLFNMAEILAHQPAPRGPNLAIITNAGGPGVMATDALMLDGGQLAPLSPESLDGLNKVLPPFWSHGNPIDVLGDATPERYKQAMEICAKDPNVQGLLVLLTPQAMTDPTLTARQVAPLGKIEGKPVLASWMGGADVREGRGILGAAGIASFDAPEAAINAFLHLVQYRRNQELLYEQPAALPEDWQPNQARVRTLIDAVRKSNRTLLTEYEAKELLGCYGIPTVPTVNAPTVDDAVIEARRVGYPVVVKLWSEVITHKTDAGGVMLNLADDDAVRSAFARIKENALAYSRRKREGEAPAEPVSDVKSLQGTGSAPASPSQHLDSEAFLGVTVQPMIRMKGYELIVGSSVDAQFGPTILFGSGGVLVEVFKDRALGLPPLNRTLARRLIERTQIYKALQGIRGQPAIPMDQLETLLVRFSYLLCDFLDIQEIDINPLLASPEGLLALDARVLLAPSNTKATLTIEPYPNQYTTAWQFKDGAPIIVRAIRAEDEPLIQGLHATLSEQSIRMRFFSMVKTLSRDSLIRLCHLDYAREMALVAERKNAEGKPELIGVSRYYMNPQTGVAEFAVTVSDSVQSQGLGQHLMERLIAVARERGVKHLLGNVLRDNRPMLGLAKELGFREKSSSDPGVMQVILDL
ncbi:MAG TPA: bifunctional acetate--CoA ligase family protein/GNAT family N-acetyltransferase [Gemmataceae bacterium]|nr:bifunctional acetate--CoA ligase family protein/GNAT family N-acetyltransferase [Gemmataceae bacterium]